MAADVVILSREGLNELIAANRIASGTDVNLARVPLGVAVRAGTPKPDVSTVDSFKQVLLKAKTIAIPGSTGGIWLTTDVFPRLGMAERIKHARADRQLNNFNPLRAGGQANRLFPVAKIGSESPFPGNFRRQNADFLHPRGPRRDVILNILARRRHPAPVVPLPGA